MGSRKGLTPAALANAHDVRWHRVKRHAGDPGNERADRLADQGVQAVLARPPGPFRAESGLV